MVITSRITALAVLATILNLFAILYFLIATSDGHLLSLQLHLVAEIQFLVIIGWLLAKLLSPGEGPIFDR